MAVRHHNLHVSEDRRYANAAVRLSGAPDLTRVRLFIVREHFAVGEAHEVAREIVRFVAQHIDPVIRNRFERRG